MFPGIVASEFGCLEGYLSSDTIAKNTIYSQHPYVHYRSKECAYFYSTQKSSISRIVTASRCPNCRKTLSSKKALKMAQLRHPDLPPKKVHLTEILEKEEMLGVSDILILPNSSTSVSGKRTQCTKKKVEILKIIYCTSSNIFVEMPLKDKNQPALAAFNEIVVEMEPQISKRRKEEFVQSYQVLEVKLP